MRIDNPPVVVFENEDGNLQTHLSPKGRSYRQYGSLIADLMRHVAKFFKVDEQDVWEWVEKKRYRSPSPVTEIKPN